MALSSKEDTKIKIPLIDARRGYIYGAIYGENLSQILKPQYLKLETLKCAQENLLEDYTYISNQEFEDINIEKYNPDIEKIVNTCSNRENINPHAVNPIYLKMTEAEEKQNLEII